MKEADFSNFSCMFLNPNNCFHLNSNCSDLLENEKTPGTSKKKHSVAKKMF